MTCCPWPQLGVHSVEDLKFLDAEDFKSLKKDLSDMDAKIQYTKLTKEMTHRGFNNVPSVPTCLPPPHGSSALILPSRLLLTPRLNVSRSTLETSINLFWVRGGLRRVGGAVSGVDHPSTPRPP